MQALRRRVLLAHGDVEVGRSLLRSVLPDLEGGAPLPRGRARAALARALLDSEPHRALALAELAEADLEAAGEGFARERAALAAVRAAHPLNVNASDAVVGPRKKGSERADRRSARRRSSGAS